MTPPDTRPPSEFLVIRRHRYALDTVVAETETVTVTVTVTVYRATSPDGQWRGHFPGDVVKDSYFVARLRQPDTVSVTDDHDRWLDSLVNAVTLVPPSLAGFPDWERVRRDDVVQIEDGFVGTYLWAAFQISMYRRRLRANMARSRRPREFTAEVKRAVIAVAGHRCARCRTETALEVDHIVPVALGGTNEVMNAMTLCRTCHRAKSSAERKAFGQSLDHALRLRGLPISVFRSHDVYLQTLTRLSGWSILNVDKH